VPGGLRKTPRRGIEAVFHSTRAKGILPFRIKHLQRLHKVLFKVL
jgi:hypothetical protein